MADQEDVALLKPKPEPELGASGLSSQPLPGDSKNAGFALPGDGSTQAPIPGLSRSPSFSNSSAYMEDSEAEEASFFPPVKRLTIFDFIESLGFPQRVDKLQTSIAVQTERIRKAARTRGVNTQDRPVEEWRRRVPTEGEQLDKYKKRMRQSVDRLNKRWASTTTVTAREKTSFIAAVMNIFVSGYLIGGGPDWLPLWYTAQLLYFMPIRVYRYYKTGYQYFLADLCYFVNFLTILSLWIFPNSKRLFISTYCLAFGNNAVAIAMWRNSLVFHSMDKVVSLFIHIMPCVTLHCIVHLLPPEYQQQRFPAIYNIRTSSSDDPHHYGLSKMLVWATVPYAIWQLSYHLMITVRYREKIAAGRPTSFTWLRKSYANTWIGKGVLALPNSLQESAFMFIQYTYVCLTMLPCPLWFWSRWASGGFLSVVFIWSVHNGANYYIEVFGKRFEKELETLKKDVARWQNSPEADRALSSADFVKDIPPLGGSTGANPADGEVKERK